MSRKDACLCKNPSPEIVEENPQFPDGMRVLAVDDDTVCLRTLVGLLQTCRYEVTATTKPHEALEMLREKKDEFHIVITEVKMVDMDGFTLLEIIGLEMDIPVVMLSACEDTNTVIKGIKSGARDYLLKPPRIEEMKNIWQHVIRKHVNVENNNNSRNGSCGRCKKYYNSSCCSLKEEDVEIAEENPTHPHPHACSQHYTEDNNIIGEVKAGIVEGGNSLSRPRKSRVHWSPHMHAKFIDAVHKLQLDGAVPKRILELMNIPGLTRENVASHLQKYKNSLKKQDAQGSRRSHRSNSSSNSSSSSYVDHPTTSTISNSSNIFGTNISSTIFHHQMLNNNSNTSQGLQAGCHPTTNYNYKAAAAAAIASHLINPNLLSPQTNQNLQQQQQQNMLLQAQMYGSSRQVDHQVLPPLIKTHQLSAGVQPLIPAVPDFKWLDFNSYLSGLARPSCHDQYSNIINNIPSASPSTFASARLLPAAACGNGGSTSSDPAGGPSSLWSLNRTCNSSAATSSSIPSSSLRQRQVALSSSTSTTSGPGGTFGKLLGHPHLANSSSPVQNEARSFMNFNNRDGDNDFRGLAEIFQLNIKDLSTGNDSLKTVHATFQPQHPSENMEIETSCYNCSDSSSEDDLSVMVKQFTCSNDSTPRL